MLFPTTLLSLENIVNVALRLLAATVHGQNSTLYFIYLLTIIIDASMGERKLDEGVGVWITG